MTYRIPHLALGLAGASAALLALAACGGGGVTPGTTVAYDATLRLDAPVCSTGCEVPMPEATALFADSTRLVAGEPTLGSPGTLTVTAGASAATLVRAPGARSYAAPISVFPATAYTFHASGSDEIGAFQTSITLPRAPFIISPQPDSTVYPARRDLVVKWNLENVSFSDSVEIVLRTDGPVDSLVRRARAISADSLRFTSAELSQLPFGVTGTVRVTHYRVQAVSARGLRSGRAVAAAHALVAVYVLAPESPGQ